MARIQLGAMAFQRGHSRPSDSAATGGTIEISGKLLGGKGAVIMRLVISLCKKQLDLFWRRLNILRKKRKLNFTIVEVGSASFFILHGPNVHHSINEKGSSRHLLAEP
jgi:hypothetical protein